MVAPAADPRQIVLAFTGPSKMHIDASGDLVMHLDASEVRFHKPIIYQPPTEDGSARTEVAGRYRLGANNQVGFDVAAYDRTRPLVIDPALTYSSYLGGSGYETTTAIAIDSAGRAYVTGETDSTDFPTECALQPANHAGTISQSDAFVVAFNPTDGTLLYSTYLGGSGDDYGLRIAVDPGGRAYLTGWTDSSTFPSVNALQPAMGGRDDTFVSVLDSNGASVLYSTFLGGSEADWGRGIAVDDADNIYVTGTTYSTNFPTANAFQSVKHTPFGVPDVFLVKLDPLGTSLVYGTYLGGSKYNFVGGIGVDAIGRAYVSGSTDASDFPTVNAFQPAFGGGQNDAFLAAFDPGGSVVYSTFFGGSDDDAAIAIAVDPTGAVVVTGSTQSTDLVMVNPVQASNNGGPVSYYGGVYGVERLPDGQPEAADAGGSARQAGLPAVLRRRAIRCCSPRSAFAVGGRARRAPCRAKAATRVRA